VLCPPCILHLVLPLMAGERQRSRERFDSALHWVQVTRPPSVLYSSILHTFYWALGPHFVFRARYLLSGQASSCPLVVRYLTGWRLLIYWRLSALSWLSGFSANSPSVITYLFVFLFISISMTTLTRSLLPHVLISFHVVRHLTTTRHIPTYPDMLALKIPITKDAESRRLLLKLILYRLPLYDAIDMLLKVLACLVNVG
jgi:hypothetical protein